MIIQTVKWDVFEKQLTQIRKKVFIQEQGITQADEWDEHDCTANHIVVSLPNPHNSVSNIIGCARLVHTEHQVQIGRVAVLPQFRGKGIAKAMVKHGVMTAMQHHYPAHVNIYLNAQNHLIELYASLQFLPQGDTFLDAGIAHTKMIFNDKNVDLPAYFANQTLEIKQPKSLACLITLMASNSVRKIQILSDNLSSTLYNQSELAHTLSAFVRTHRHAHVDIIVANTHNLGKTRHALVELAQRMPSKVRVQKITQSMLDTQSITSNKDTLTFDNSGFITLFDSYNCQGFGVFADKVKVQQAQSHFEYIWQAHCERDPNLTKLAL